VETFFTSNLDEILVGANTSSLERFGAQLFIFVGNHVHAKREFVDIGALSSQVENSDLWVRDTAVKSGFGVRLVLAVAVASSWSSSHLDES
jgi:hypothetical protein